jgi:serine/threonine protein kinase, bacterial
MIESSLLTPGNLLSNRYEVVRELGRGGFGRTYLAIDRNKFGEKCVLKEFAPQVRGQAELQKAKELFERETGILYKLKHPQIPAFRELLRVDGLQSESLFLVQDFIDGENYLDRVNQRVSQGKVFNEGEVVQFLQHLLPVLNYIHNLGVIHRDISPDNIIYRYSDRLPVLIDFGCVKEIAATAVSRYSTAKIATRIGKQGYAPDEQMIRGKVSPASDLYAVAATALTLLTGKDATEIYNPAEAKWEWRKFVSLSPELGAIIDRLLQYNPQHRYQTAKEVLAILPASTNYAAASFNTAAPNNPQPITHANKISQLKTIEISPRQPAATTPKTELPARDPNEWKKPALQVTKLMSGLFIACLGISTVAKWVQSIDPGKMISDSFSSAKTSLEKSIPNPLKSASPSPSVQQQQQDLSQKLKQRNISSVKFYRQVDRAFHAKHPELNGRSLTSKAEDNKLRQEWQDLATQMLEQQSK